MPRAIPLNSWQVLLCKRLKRARLSISRMIGCDKWPVSRARDVRRPAIPGSISAVHTLQRGEATAMSHSISTLLTRNLYDVFGENDPARRRAAIDEIYAEDCVFYEPNGDVYHGRDEI